MLTFSVRYLVLPLCLLLSGAVYFTLIYHPGLRASLPATLLDFIAFSASISSAAFWLFIWEWKLPALSFAMNQRQKITDLVFSTFSIVVVGLGHVLILQIPAENALENFLGLARLPLALQILFGLVFHDLLLYWYHRIQHETGDSFLWRVHRPHHSPDRLHMLSGGRNHLIDLCALVASLALTRCLGFPDEAMFWIMWYPTIIGAIHHSNLDLRLGPLNYLIPGPEIHRIHHSVHIGEALNYAPSFPLWDYAFGTMMPLKKAEEVIYGTPVGDDTRDTIVTAHTYPFELWGEKKENAAAVPD